MADNDAPTADTTAPHTGSGTPAPQRWITVAAAALLVLAAYTAGSPELNAPWIIGDEYLFIADNPDVTGAGRDEPLWQRCLNIFGHVHEDLYQPVPILTYALEWSLWGEQRLFHIRLTDVLLHTLNGLLLWVLLRRLLTCLRPSDSDHTALTWALALLWTLHPTLVSAYAADMGRTHILSATFAMLSLLWHLKTLETGRGSWFVAAMAALLLAMMSKAVVGWVGLVLVIECALLGLRATLRSPRVYIVAAMGFLFALLTLTTSKEAGLIADSQLALFGDPISRSFLAVWIYLRNVVAPLNQLSTWCLSDIHTSWTYPLVWVGVLLTALGAALALWAARRPTLRGAAVGLVWFAALLAPVIGVVGGRAAAAQDRYLYQPLMGLLLALAILLARWIARAATPHAARRRITACVTTAVLVAAAMLWHDRGLAFDARDTLRRAERVVRLNPDDPRALEGLTIAHSFAYTRDTTRPDHAARAQFQQEFRNMLLRTAALGREHPEHFLDQADRAAFHRRIAHQLWLTGSSDASLEQARAAQELEPDAPLTWLRLAYAYRSLERWDDALAAYRKLETLLPKDDPYHAARLTELADLLLNRFNDPLQALAKYREALASPQMPDEVWPIAMLGAARCEVLVGEGSRGFQLANEVMRKYPGNVEAWEIIALYHLRSHHWNDAALAYLAVLKQQPKHYGALRGFHEVCVQAGQYREAALAWNTAAHRAPEFPPFRAYLAWAAALAEDESAAAQADALLKENPHHRYACLTRMLLALRSGQIEEALTWIQTAREGTPLPQARELLRAAETLRVMSDRGELPPEAMLARAALRTALGEADSARALLDDYLETHPDSPWHPLAKRLGADIAADQPQP